MPLYFSYGSNMDAVAMAARCPRSKPIGVARLARHRLAVMREGWLTIVRDPGGNVHGVLWDIAFADMPALDRYEGLGAGLYAKTQQSVTTEKGARRALVYFGANAGPGVARADYLEAVIVAARHWGLPRASLVALAEFKRAARAPSLRAKRSNPD